MEKHLAAITFALNEQSGKPALMTQLADEKLWKRLETRLAVDPAVRASVDEENTEKLYGYVERLAFAKRQAAYVGAHTSAKKTAASRKNGKKGGRPRAGL